MKLIKVLLHYISSPQKDVKKNENYSIDFKKGYAQILFIFLVLEFTQSTNSNTIIEFPVCIQNNFSSRILLYCEFLAKSMPFDKHHV